MTAQSGVRQQIESGGTVFKGAMLISGTMIGGGMLALPVASAEAGLVPTLVVYFLSWLFMAATGLLLFEVNLWHKGENNLVTMAGKTLGRPGKVLTWILYIFMFYCLMTAYTVGVACFFSTLAPELFSGILGLFGGAVCFLPVLVKGTRLAGKLNLWLIGGLAISYVLFVLFGAPYVQAELISHADWSYTFAAFPIIFASFAYQGIVPTLSTYLDRDPQKMKRAIWMGTLIPFAVYVLWEILILGIVPMESLKGATSAVEPLSLWLSNPYVDVIGQSFAFFALITSFLGVALGLVDFLADGLSIEKKGRGKLFLGLMVLVPPVLLNLLFGNLFITALGFAGGIGSALLLGLLPIAMAWKGRPLNPDSTYRVPGGRPLLALLAAFCLFELLFELSSII